MTLDLPENLLSTGDVIYQWVTLVEEYGGGKPFTIGCKSTVGFDYSDSIDVFSQDQSTIEALWSNSDSIKDKTVDSQAEDLRLDVHEWVAGTDYSPVAPATESAGNTVHACYFAKELPKIGRDPNDFHINYKAYMGARIYSSNIDTDFISIPEENDFYIYLGSPPSYADYYMYNVVADASDALKTSTMVMLIAVVVLNNF